MGANGSSMPTLVEESTPVLHARRGKFIGLAATSMLRRLEQLLGCLPVAIYPRLGNHRRTRFSIVNSFTLRLLEVRSETHALSRVQLNSRRHLQGGQS